MPARTRSRSNQGPAGVLIYNGVPGDPATQTIFSEVTKDVTSKKPYGDKPLSILKTTASGGIISGGGKGKNQPFFENYPLLSTQSTKSAGLQLVSDNDSINRVLAQSGPLTPKVHLPLAIFEMKDLPRMLKHAGDLLHGIKNNPSGLSPDKEAASAVLAYQFGWAPLIQDIGRMIDFGDTVRKRQRDIMKANSKGGLRRKVMLAEDSKTASGDQILWSSYAVKLQPKFTVTESAKKWATLRWTVRDQKQIGRVPTWNEAFRASYGLNRGHIPIQIWKGLPWTWAIDWFADISNVLTANYNSIYYQPSMINIMTFRESTTVWEPYVNEKPYGTITLSGGTVTETSKNRVQKAPNTNVRIKLPFMDNFKLSILGSFAILRIRGR